MTVKALLVRIGADVSDFKAKMNQIEKGVDKHKGKIQKGLNKVSLAFVGIGIAAGKASIDFNRSMANIATLIPGNVKRVEELKDSVQDLSIVTGKSTGDIADGLYQVISAFGDTSDTVKILDTNVRAAAAGLASTTDAINLTSAVTKGYGDTTAAAVKKAADLAFVTVKLGQTTFPELAGSIGRVIPIAKSMNVSQEELFAGFAALTGVTGGAAEVSTQFAGILGALIKPTAEMEKAIKSYGYASGEAMIQDLGFMETLKKLTETTDGTSMGLGKLFSRKEGLVGVTALLGAQEEDYTKKLAAMGDAVGAADEAYGEMTEGINKTGFAFDRAKASIVVMLQKLGDELAPVILSVANGISKFVGKIGKLIEAFSKAPKSVKSTVLALGGLLALSAPLFKMFMMMRMGMGGVGKLLGLKMAPSIARVAGSLKALPAIGAAAFVGWQAGRLIGELTGLDKVIQDVAGSLLDTAGYAKGMNVEWEKIPGHTERAAKAQEIFAAASKLSGEEITNLKDAAVVLGAEYRKTGTTGNKMLDAWLKKTGFTVEVTKKFEKGVSDVGDAAGKSRKPIIDLKEVASDLGIVLKSDLVEELKKAEYWLKEFKKTGEATPSGIKTLKDRIKDLKTELGLLGKEVKVAGSDLIGGIFTPAVYAAAKAIKKLDEKAEAAGVSLRTKLEKELRNTIKTFEELAEKGQLVTDDQRKMVDDIIALHIRLGEAIPPKWKQMHEDLKEETVTTIDFMDTTWGQFLGGIADAFGDMVGAIKIEGGKLKIDFNTLWGDIKLGFRQMISDMVSNFLKDFVQGIVRGATTAGTATATLAGGMTTLGSGIAGLASGVASILPTVATAIAAAATTLAGAIPAIAAVGAVAIALYAGFMAVNKLLGSTSSRAMDATNRLLEKIWANTKELRDIMFIDYRQILLRDQVRRWQSGLEKQDVQSNILQAVYDRLGEIKSSINDVNSTVGDVISAINAIPKKGTGGHFVKRQLAVIGDVPETIIPDKDLPDFAAALAPGGDSFKANLNIYALDAKSIRDMVRGEFGEEILTWIETKMPKTRLQRALS